MKCVDYKKLLIVLMLIFFILPKSIPDITSISIKELGVESILQTSEFQWNVTLHNTDIDEGRALALDQNEDIILTGSYYNSSTNTTDLIIIKYQKDGSFDWNRTWGGNSEESGLDITVDNSNNIYVTGYTASFGNGSYDICLLKYSNTGVLLWNRTWGDINADKGYGIKTDSLGNVYVGGYSNINNGYDDVVLLKFDGVSGDLLKNTTWGEYYDDRALDLIIDSSGNIYLTGYTDNFGAIVRDLFLIKYNSSGDLVFNKTYGDDRWHEGRSLIFNSDNDIIIAGFIQNFGNGGDLLVFKANSSTGELEWGQYWGGTEHDYAYDIALDSNGNIYLTGSTESYEGIHKKVCIVKFNNTGDYQWIKTFSNDIEDVAYGIVIDPFDEIYITGKTKFNETNYDIFLLNEYPVPFDFILSSDATWPDTDGSFNLTWTISLDAKNYSLFQSNESIHKDNPNITPIIVGNTNRSCSIISLEEGLYYFRVFAFNNYGNISSPEIQIMVDYSPSNFILHDITPEINPNGKVSLSWGESLGANNFSIYFNSVFISGEDNKGTLIVEGLSQFAYEIPGIFSDGLYYFVIMARNDAGNTLSNCENVYIQKLPTVFSLSKEIEPESYDEDGNFFLVWTRSNYSQSYFIYRSTQNFTDVNDDSVSLLDTYIPDFEWPEYRFSISESKSGKYYFMVVAYNSQGNYTSNCIEIEVRLPQEPQEPTEPPNFLMLLLIILIPSIAVLGLLGILFYLRKKRKSKIEEI